MIGWFGAGVGSFFTNYEIARHTHTILDLAITLDILKIEIHS